MSDTNANVTAPVAAQPSQPVVENKFQLSEYCVKLLREEPFFAALSRRIDKTLCEAIPTAGVRINKGSQNFELLYNPKFFDGLTEKQRINVLRHEYYHLILGHVTGRKPGEIQDDLKSQQLHKLWNIATDLAINSHLSDLPEDCCFPGKGPFKDYPPAMNAEWYYAKLKNDPDNQKMLEMLEKLQKMIGNHDAWNGEGEQDTEQQAANDMAEQKLKDILRRVVNECAADSSWGTISQEMRKEIMERIKSRLNWKSILRYFIKQSVKCDRTSSIRRLNRRYQYIHPGRKTNRIANLAIAIDQSGSVSDELLATFFGELNGLAKLASFTVIPFDTTAPEDKIYKWKKGQKHKMTRVLSGGTEFSCFLDYVENRDFSGVIVLTDMCAPKPRPSRVQRLWITDEANAAKPYFQPDQRDLLIGIPIKSE